MEKGWWYRASQEEKLAQIDGAIELGMTIAQCAMNCRCFNDDNGLQHAGNAVGLFARYHGRKFVADEHKEVQRRKKIHKVQRRRFDIQDAKNSYLSGEPVDFWGAR